MLTHFLSVTIQESSRLRRELRTIAMWSSFTHIAKQAQNQLEQGLGEVIKAGEGLIEKVEDIVESGDGRQDQAVPAVDLSNLDDSDLSSLNGSDSDGEVTFRGPMRGSRRSVEADVDEDPEDVEGEEGDGSGGLLGGLDSSLGQVGGVLTSLMARATGRTASDSDEDEETSECIDSSNKTRDSPSKSRQPQLQHQLAAALAEVTVLKQVAFRTTCPSVCACVVFPCCSSLINDYMAYAGHAATARSSCRGRSKQAANTGADVGVGADRHSLCWHTQRPQR